MRTKLKAFGAAAAAAMILSGCNADPGALPLPGGADLGDNPIDVTIEFRDVLDLVPQSAVRVNDIAVGRVTDIKLKDWTAEVKIKLNNDVVLPANAVATIRQSSLLGEKFVSLAPPATGAAGRLSDNDRIALDASGRNPEIEEVLGAASLLLNGGGIEKVNTITKELNKALDGNEAEVKQFLRSSEAFLGQLDDNKQAIIGSLEKVDRLAIAANDQRDAITGALDELPEALRVLDEQRDDLVGLLKALERLGDTATEVVKASREDTVANLQSLTPILRNLTLASDDLAGNVSTLLTYPFPDIVVGDLFDAEYNAVKCDNDDELHQTPRSCTGDFFNLNININASADQLAGIIGVGLPGADSLGASTAAADDDDSLGLVELVEGLVPAAGSGQVPSLPGLPGLGNPDPQTSGEPAAGGAAPRPTLCSLLNLCRTAAGSVDRQVADLGDLLLRPEVTR